MQRLNHRVQLPSSKIGKPENLRKGSRCERRQPATFLATRQSLYRRAWNLEWNFKGIDLVKSCQVGLVSFMFKIQVVKLLVRSFVTFVIPKNRKSCHHGYHWALLLQGIGRLERFLWRIRLQGDLDGSRDTGWRCKVMNQLAQAWTNMVPAACH